jgi:glycosyltransferase involved in cell wall biosynthesis
MRIGFDAKRIFYNRSGLGNYGRNTIRILQIYFPDNEYCLYTPSTKNSLWSSQDKNIHICLPQRLQDKLFKDYWRAFSMTKQVSSDNLDLFHGLNNELPKNIHRTNTKTLMTVHDLIFIRFPQYYRPIDRIVYKLKSKYSVGIADKIITDTRQTKEDVVTFFNADPDKIEIVYLSCNPIFYQHVSASVIEKVKEKYSLPDQYILSVGTIEERKNLLSVVKAMHKDSIDMPLVTIGRSTKYCDTIRQYVAQKNLENQFLFYHTIETSDLPAIYQGADILVFISVFEGFGFPILEALYSKTPVISSTNGCFEEVGGKSSLYVNPHDIDEIAHCIKKVLDDSNLRTKMINDGYAHAQSFNEDVIVKKMMAVYKSICS